MEREATLVETLGIPQRVVQQIKTKPRTTTICPLCKTRFKKDDPTILIDLAKRFYINSGKDNNFEHTVRIQICERCAQPVIRQRREAMDGLISLLAEILAEEVLKDLNKEREQRALGSD